jgi:phosphatidylinositol glycan class B
VQALRLSPSTRDELLLAAPKTLQAIFAGLGDYYTWKLAERIYGHDSSEAWAALTLTVVSPWQWFCSTRTFSNSLETTLTVIALYYWPWHWSTKTGVKKDIQVYSEDLGICDADDPSQMSVEEIALLRRALLLAAVATIMRPTNILIWATLSWLTFLQHTSSGWLLKIPWTDQSAWVHATSWSFVPNRNERMMFARETFACGISVLFLSILIDRLYYQMWSLPPLNFLRFNVVESISVFYGNNDWHYYLSQGYPLLLTTALPFAITGMYQALQGGNPFGTASATSKRILSQLATVCLVTPLALSIISHKEVRFIYPLLPALHILSAFPLTTFFGPAVNPGLTMPSSLSINSNSTILIKRTVLFMLVAINATIAIYTSRIHNSGVISVMDYLRHQHSIHYLPPSSASPHTASKTPSQTNMTVAFLMPCHSTPWRSHLIHPDIHAWALTCEPPLQLDAASRAAYLDEADVFYADPILWLRSHMSRQPPRSHGIFGLRTPGSNRRRDIELSTGGRREWPDYLVFFEHLESVMHTALQDSGYQECWRGFNTHWHDDWRRKGDVVVWCLDKENEEKVEHERRSAHHRRPAFERAEEQAMEVAGQGKAKAEKPKPLQTPHQHEGRILGGGRGPYGIGSDVLHPQHKQKPKARPVAGESTVERPFWKKREKVAEQPYSGLWSYLWPFGKQKKESSWWQGGKWS